MGAVYKETEEFKLYERAMAEWNTHGYGERIDRTLMIKIYLVRECAVIQITKRNGVNAENGVNTAESLDAEELQFVELKTCSVEEYQRQMAALGVNAAWDRKFDELDSGNTARSKFTELNDRFTAPWRSKRDL